MKQLRTRQAKILGALGVIGSILCGIMLALVPGEIAMKIATACAMAYFLFLAFEGLTAGAVMLDGDDLLIAKSREIKRIALEEVVCIRTFPIFRYLGILTLKFRDGNRSRTMVADQDLTWIMSRMPRSAVTPYWRDRIGQDVVSVGNTALEDWHEISDRGRRWLVS